MRRATAALCSTLLFLATFSHGYAQTQPTASGPLHTQGASFVDAQGQPFRITGVNWFGLETDSYAPHGLWARNYGDMLDQIASAGFNTIRLPFSNQLLDPSSMPQGIDYTRNPDLQGLNGLEVMDHIIAAAGQRGLRVILDRHRPTAAGQTELWYSNDVPESRWIQDWVMLAQRYAGNPTVIGADLHNEPHGAASWGDGNPATDWRLAAQRAGNAILAVNPDWLIIVQGVERYGNDWYWWGGNLEGASDAPVVLSAPNKLVYSTHDYGPGVYQQKWFDAPGFPANLPGIWLAHWAFLAQGNVAPVLVGEFGGRSVGSDREGVWQKSLVDFIRQNNLSYTYWAWNPDSGDTGGILDDDWSTLDQSKLAMLAGTQSDAAVVAQTGSNASPSGDSTTETGGADSSALGTSASSSPDGGADQGTSASAATAGSADQGTTAETGGADASMGGVTSDGTSASPAVAESGGSDASALGTTSSSTPGGDASSGTNYAPGGPFDPDLSHAQQGIGGPNDPDSVHRQAREHDERVYLQDFGKPWQYAVYVTSP